MQFDTLIAKIDNNVRSIEDVKSKFGILDEETSCKKQLAMAKDESTNISNSQICHI